MNKTGKIIAGLIVLIVVVLVVINLGKSQSNDKIKIGVIAPLTGFLADYGENIRDGVLAAEIPDNIEFIFEDDACDPAKAVSAYKKLVDFEKVDFLIGPGCGSPQEAVAPLLKESNVITLVPSAAPRDLYSLSEGHFYNIQYSLENESKFVAEQMYERGYRNVALMSAQNAFSVAHADSFRENFKGTIAVDSIIKDETSDTRSEALKVKNANVDAVYAPDVSIFFANGLVNLRELGVTVPVFTMYAAELPAVRPLVPDVYYSFPGDLEGAEGAVYHLSQEAGELLAQTVSTCNGEYLCVKESFDSSGDFDENGVYKRTLILKQIKDGEPVLVD